MKRLTAVIVVAGLTALAPSFAAGANAALPDGCPADADNTNPVIASVTATDAVLPAAGRAAVIVTFAANDPVGPVTCTDATGVATTTDASSGIEDFVVFATPNEPDEGDEEDVVVANEYSVVSGTRESGTWSARLWLDKSHSTGQWSVHVRAEDADSNKVESLAAATFQVRYNVSLSANAAPEPVKKGAYFTVSGRLSGVTSSGYEAAPAGIVIRIYFQAKGTKTWTYAGAAKTTSTGRYTRRFKAARDGSWQARYTGGDYIVSKSSTADFLDVR